MKYFSFSLYIVIFALWSELAFAKQDILTLSPKVCVVSEQQEYCDLELKLTLNMPKKMDVCLYQESSKLQCWQQVKIAKLDHKARVQVATIYSLIDPHTDELLATARIEVQSTRAKTTRRRLRSPWSFF
ncbi:hypothetical protein AMS58_01555 [Pseudoalteromonas porphyrae]|uniref:DUF3019 domain-containing protein n=2 Tax=Pseudoalteromonas TaxID=53246 RepID=A0A0N0M0E7_9GAMM|nr:MULTISPECIES: DUF3019 domain-containing protein [Pseudoalteromonas]KPH63978.1 hypothetical protein ADS77_08725 [Pseudoalteromonas porphyrae]KPH96271.1 hypothetical protein AMS58_01555 [Pseudoalteromonas porphyrae]NMR25506.1 DUF3019 domain-containing protein [Pseudoalteromonas sp. NEC-BIFX-2020_015]NNG42295.1 DUF3019 domain-containing protein [Pseudoalteromonas sp. NEC-BIFX-2020_002]